jgi:hypothetical protein
MINPNDGKRDPKAPKTYGMAIGASRGMRAGTAGEAVNTGFREGIGQKPVPKIDRSKLPSNGNGAAVGAYTGAIEGYSKKATPVKTGDNKKKPPLDKSDKIKPEAYKAYILARGKR